MSALGYSQQFAGTETGEVTESEQRAKRARQRTMVVIPRTDEDNRTTGEYDVFAPNGTFAVDFTHDERCGCPDVSENNPDQCIHERRVAIAITNGDVPAPGRQVRDDPVQSQLDELRVAHTEVTVEAQQGGQQTLTRIAELHNRKDKLEEIIRRVEGHLETTTGGESDGD